MVGKQSLRDCRRQARESRLGMENQGGKKSKKPPKPKKPVERTLMELSITVGYLGADVHPEEIDKLHKLLLEECESGLVSLERGEVEKNLHFQMVARAWGTSARSFGSVVKKYMGWEGDDMSRGKVTCKTLAQRNLHTFNGMVGYCLNDQGQEHFKTVADNITEDQIKEGRTLHQLHGRDLKKRVCLTSRNLFERAYMYYLYFERKMMSRSLTGILLGMIKSNSYYPSAAWVIPTHGRGMDLRRASSLWNSLLFPGNASLDDVTNIFFDSRSPIGRRYHADEFEYVEEVDLELRRKARDADLEDEREDRLAADLGDLTCSESLPDYIPLVPQMPMLEDDFLEVGNGGTVAAVLGKGTEEDPVRVEEDTRGTTSDPILVGEERDGRDPLYNRFCEEEMTLPPSPNQMSWLFSSGSDL